jgi:quinol monooxygenase YgiN
MKSTKKYPRSEAPFHMQKIRRILLAALIALPLMAASQSIQAQPELNKSAMYGLIGKIKTQPGQRDRLSAILLKGTSAMPGCLSYIVANDPQDPDAIWITEVWDSVESHNASLALPAVKQAMVEGRPLITGFGERFETQPLGGYGLAPGR